jgi:heme/copper-type cytochrome/quinol oxidase subunit 1
MFIGFHLTFLVQHWLGNQGMPRRYADYLPTDDFTLLHALSSIGAFVLGASTLPFIWNVVKSYRYGRVVTVDDPWGFGNSLEWATSCPPPRHNSPSYPASAPNGLPSNCTTHTLSTDSATKPTPRANPRPTRSPHSPPALNTNPTTIPSRADVVAGNSARL